MKKNVILAIIVTIVVLFSACKKETNLIKVQKIDPIEQKILNFKEQMKNPNKSDETISIDSAVWYMEAALNYTYCYTNEEINRSELNTIQMDSAIIYFENNNEGISLNKVQQYYTNIEQILETSYNYIDEEQKYYDLVDVSFKDNTFKVYYTFVLNKVIGQDKSWIYWFSAPPMIYKEANQYVAYPAAAGSGYYTDVDFFVNEPTNNFATTTNPYGDYLIFYQECSNNSPQYVIGDWEMNYYYHHADDALAEARQNIPTGFTFKSWRMDSREWYLNNYGIHHRVHYIEVYYGILHAGGSQGQ